MPFAANIPGLPTDPRSSRFLLLAQLAGLAGTGWLVWNNSIAPKLAWQSLASIAARASFYVLLTWAVSALMTFLIYLVVADEEPANLVTVSVRASAAAAWFAPAIILLSTLSPAGLFASLVIIVNTSRLLILGWLPGNAASPERVVRWNPWPAIAAAFVLQAGVVALLWRSPFLAAGAFALSSAIITTLAVTRSGSKPEKPRAMPPSTLSIALTILLAATVSTASLKFREYAANASDGSFDASMPNPGGATEITKPETDTFAMGGGGFPGVILRPLHKPESTLLVAPQPNLVKQSEQPTRPLSIPFTGEYWMYQPPFIRPPKTSVLRQGTPLELSFHTNNGTSMSMEARQKLAAPIELACCARLDIEIAQRGEPTELLLTVTLIDSQAKQSLDLGMASVGIDTAQTLRFPIPTGSEIRKFDEIRIVYRRGLRLSRSVNLAVERFLLIPRGR